MTALPMTKLPFHSTSHSNGVRGSKSDRADLRIAAIVPRGEVIRNFVHSGCFEQIADDCELSLLSVVNGAEFADIAGALNADLYSLEPVRERWPARFQREILDMATDDGCGLKPQKSGGEFAIAKPEPFATRPCAK